MNPLASEWIAKAEGDFATARRELRARVAPNYDAACFHAQQCAEKYLKAYLQEIGAPFGRTHDLVALLDLAPTPDPHLVALRSDLRILSAFAVAFRYPGDAADRAMAREAIAACLRVRRAARVGMALPP
jgi:HEPN domain-containing protein